MQVSRRELLRIAALGAVASGCSRADRVARPTASTTTSRAAGSSPPAHIAGSGEPSPALSQPDITSAPEIVHGPRSSTSVALTFHGAGARAIARAVLHELELAGVRGTVLALGTWLDSEPEMARRVLSAGHELGNHTQHHLPMRGLGAATALREIVQCRQTLHRLTGSPGRWFRASGTQHTTPTIRTAAAHAGYAQCLSYDVDSLDWTDPAPEVIVRTVLDQVRGGSIVSLHLGHAGTVSALPALLDGLHKKKLEATTVGKLVG